jgi:hypothetical protein
MIAGELGKNGVNFFGRKHDRNFGRAFDPLDVVHPVKFLVQNNLVKKKERAQGLVLGGRGDVATDGKVGQESADLDFPHRFRMSFAVKQDETFDPVDVGSFGPDAIMPEPEMLPHLVEQFRRIGSRGTGKQSHVAGIIVKPLVGGSKKELGANSWELGKRVNGDQ